MKNVILLLSLLLAGILSNAQKTWNLQQCVDTAIRNNLTIRQMSITSDLNYISVQQSKANRLPIINGQATQGVNSGRSLNPASNQYTTQSFNTNNFSLTGSIVLFNGFQLLNKIRVNETYYQASLSDYEKLKYDIVMDVLNGYLQVLYAYETVKNAEKQVESSQAQFDKTAIWVNAGKLAEGNLLTLKSQLVSDKYSLISAESDLKTSILTLQQLMEIPATDDFNVDYTIPLEPSLLTNDNVAGIYKKSLEFLPEIKSSEQRTLIQEYNIKVAQGALLPKLILSGNLSTNYSSISQQASLTYNNSLRTIGYLQSNPSEMVLGNVTTPVYNYSNYGFMDQLGDNFSKGVLLTLSIPIYNNHQAVNNIKIQNLNLESSRLTEQQTKNTVRKTIEQAYNQVHNSQAKFAAATEQLNAENASFTNAQSRFDAGVLNATDLLVEKNKLVKSQSDILLAKYDLIFRTKILDYYEGKLKF